MKVSESTAKAGAASAAVLPVRMTRRQAMALAGAVLIGLPWIGGGLSSVAAFATPPARALSGGIVPRQVAAGHVSDLTDGVPKSVMFGDETVYLVKHGSRIVALSGTSPVKGGLLAFHKAMNEFYDPCTGSTFDIDGKCVAGPDSGDMRRRIVSVSTGRIIVGGLQER